MNTFLKSFRVTNFKAVKDSGSVKLMPLTVFIGNNGSGKSSLIESLQTVQDIVDDGLDRAMQNWFGFEHIWHKGSEHKIRQQTSNYDRLAQTNPMSFELRGKGTENFKSFTASTEISLGEGGNELFFVDEKIIIKDFTYLRNRNGKTEGIYTGKEKIDPKLGKLYPVFARDYGGIATVTVSDQLSDDESLLNDSLGWYVSEWQFLSTVPQEMGRTNPQQRTGGRIFLARDGSNIAEYLLSIRKLDQDAFDGIFETLKFVLPYAEDLQPVLTSEIERNVYLQLGERDFKVPSWLFSFGTLRILALLAVLRHPQPPPLLVIEEIENGLDPRTVHLIVDEIRRVVEEGKIQIILTTHSPYLLDLLDLSQIVLVERENSEPVFSRPADRDGLQEWSKKFSVGKLYTMGKLNTK
ncbi:MAG: ATP-binding protein [Acidobacteria bacterium]|jgi:predicted ATPase|nr:ATP-binding protein [Acidobacteriota bacterium]